MSYLSFEDAIKAVATLEHKPVTKIEYFKYYKQRDDLPKNPQIKYKNQWQGWRHFLSSLKVEKYVTLNEAKSAVQKLNPIPSGFESYRKIYRQDQKLPANPEEKYRMSGWRSWPDFVGNTATSESTNTEEYYLTYSLAKLALRKVGIPANAIEYNYTRKLDLKLPPKPDQYYKGCGWNGWHKFLSDTFYSSLDLAIAAVQDLHMVPITRDQYRSLYRYDPQLPREPDKFYSEFWRGWRHYLCTEQLSSNIFNDKKLEIQRLIDGNPIKPAKLKDEEKGEFKTYDIVQLTKKTACQLNGWSLPKGMLGEVLEVNDGNVIIKCEVADDDHAQVKSKYLKRANTPSFTEIFNDIRHGIKNKGPGFYSLASIVEEIYEEKYYYYNNNFDEDDFQYLDVTPTMLIYVFEMLPFEIRSLAVTNMVADINNWAFCYAFSMELERTENWQYLARIKSMQKRKT